MYTEEHKAQAATEAKEGTQYHVVLTSAYGRVYYNAVSMDSALEYIKKNGDKVGVSAVLNVS